MEMAAAALKLALPINQINCHHQEQRFDLSCSGSRNLLNLKVQIKRKCGFDLWAAQSQWTATTTTSVEEEEEENRRNKPPAAAVSKVEEIQITHDRGFHKDMNFLPRPLSALTCPSSLDGRNVRVAYRGAPGSFSEDAALKMYPNCETVPCDKFETAFKAVELWLVDKAILPMENSVGGSIHRNYDLLLRHRLLHIVGEVQLAVNHCLLGLHGVKKDELKFVLSHPQALDQCDTTLNKLGVSRVSVEDTAAAAQLVAAENMRETGAIASARAAKIYGLNIIEERIQDDLNNVTRFLILAREPIIPRTDRPYKTSIVFSLDEGPGVLFKALGAFALRGIELSKIESRPQRNRPLTTVDDCDNGSAKCFEYLFFVDFEASMAEHRAQYALRCLQEYATYLRVLGCYPMDITTL